MFFFLSTSILYGMQSLSSVNSRKLSLDRRNILRLHVTAVIFMDFTAQLYYVTHTHAWRQRM